MELSQNEIFSCLRNKHFVHPNINKLICETRTLYFDFLDILFSNQITGLETVKVQKGWCNSPKGMLQILSERGLH